MQHHMLLHHIERRIFGAFYLLHLLCKQPHISLILLIALVNLPFLEFVNKIMDFLFLLLLILYFIFLKYFSIFVIKIYFDFIVKIFLGTNWKMWILFLYNWQSYPRFGILLFFFYFLFILQRIFTIFRGVFLRLRIRVSHVVIFLFCLQLQ